MKAEWEKQRGEMLRRRDELWAKEARPTLLFDTIKKAGMAHAPLNHGRLFGSAVVAPKTLAVELAKLKMTECTLASDVTFRLDEVKIDFQGRANEYPLLRDGVTFELYIAECPWPVRATGAGVFKPMKNKWQGEEGFDEIGSVFIPPRQVFHVNYVLTDEAVRILATHDDVGLAIQLVGATCRDEA